MLYAIAHFLRDKMPWIWDMVDLLNSCLFSIRYGKKLKNFKFKSLPAGYKVVAICDVSTEKLVEFFAHQPEEAYKFFHPHGFDLNSVKKLRRNKAFLAYVLIENATGKIAGYCFNRSFFLGKGFRGRMVDIDFRGKGLGTAMNCLLNEVGFGIGLRLFETVNRENVASYKSALSASKVSVIEELEDGDLYLEILKG